MLALLCMGVCNVFQFVYEQFRISIVPMYFSMSYYHVYTTCRSWNWRSSLPNIRWKILRLPVKRRVYVLGASLSFFGWSHLPSAGKNWVHSWMVNKSDRTQISCFWCTQCGSLSGTLLHHSIWSVPRTGQWYREVCMIVFPKKGRAGSKRLPVRNIACECLHALWCHPYTQKLVAKTISQNVLYTGKPVYNPYLRQQKIKEQFSTNINWGINF